MRRVLTAAVLIAAIILLGGAGEKRADEAAERIRNGAERIAAACGEYIESGRAEADAQNCVEQAKRLYDGWREDMRTLTLYMNRETLSPVTEALRDMLGAAQDGNMSELSASTRRLGDALSDMGEAESCSIGNIF